MTLMEQAVELAKAGMTAQEINKIIDEDIERAKTPEPQPTPEPEPEPTPEPEPEPTPSEPSEREKELEEQLKKAQEKARRSGSEIDPEEQAKKDYDSLIAKIKHF